MLKDVVEVQVLEAYKLKLRFEDGVTGVLDLENFIDFTGVFEPLQDPQYFSQVTAKLEFGTICWPNGADIDPDVLYALVRGESIPDLSEITTEGLRS
jgi:hypothetical protein